MTVLSTMAGTHQGAYKLMTEKAQYDTSLRKIEDSLWESFKNDTPFGSIVNDLESAFSIYANKVLTRMPGMEICADDTCFKLRPDLSSVKFNEAGLSGDSLGLFLSF